MPPNLCSICAIVPHWLASLDWDDYSYLNDTTITLRSWRGMQVQAEAAVAEKKKRRRGNESNCGGNDKANCGRNEGQEDEVNEANEECQEGNTGGRKDGREGGSKKGRKRGKKGGKGKRKRGRKKGGEEGGQKGGQEINGEGGEKEVTGEEGGGGCDLCYMIVHYSYRESRCKFPAASRPYYLPPEIDPRQDERYQDVPLVFGREATKQGDSWEYRMVCLSNRSLWGAEVVKVPESWWPKYLPPMAYNDQNPEINVLLLKDWLENCRQNHKRCREIKKTTMDTGTDFLPTRLLDVQAFGTGSDPSSHLGDDVRLVYLSPPTMGSESADTIKSPQPYFTLSHCWGPPEKRPTTTTKANLSQRMERIPFIELPRTFQDAIEMTRKLGHRYLWIDSLCIVQDDEQDWAREASLMAKVYSHASCTLSALSSHDSSGGLHLEPLDEDRSYMDLSITSTPPEPYPADGSTGTRQNESDTETNMNRAFASSSSSSFPRFRLLYYSNEDWHTLYNGTNRTMHMGGLSNDISPLRSRAWTLQERELSRRIIHFARKQVLWECAELKATAQRPWHDHSSSYYYAGLDSSPQREWKGEWSEIEVESVQDLSLQSGIVQGRDGDNLVQAAVAADGAGTTLTAFSLLTAYTSECDWWAIVFDYSQRSLTKDTDKLAALSGMAQFYQRNHFPCARYVAGLWSSRLKEELFWEVEDTSRARRPAGEIYVAPSWSWASVKGGVISYKPKIPARRVREMRNKQMIMAGIWRDAADIQPGEKGNKDSRKDDKDPWKDIKDARRIITDGWEVEEINLFPRYDDPYGALEGANLIISGARLVEVELFTDTLIEPDPEYMYGSYYYYGGLKINGRWVADHAIDVEGEAERSGGRLWCLGMVAQRDYSKLRKPVIGGLLLREEEEKRDVDGDLCVYSRVGTFRHMRVATFDGVEPRRIKLI
uniref:HET domain protein pin-c3 n=1 Tax=Neurospora crassa TaxID=5141 RepID=Q1WFN4_NEUCS|nr:HET domain protein pin-c3 [Neurospora crassa]